MTVAINRVGEHVGIVIFSNPPNNFFDVALIEALIAAYRELASSDCRAIVLCSEGKHFCAGANFRRSTPSNEAPSPPARHLYEAGIDLFSQPLPVVAAVQGSAVGGGLGLALSADFRVVARTARLVANFSHLGFHHGFGLTATLPPLVGQQIALETLYNSREFDGAGAVAAGLCDRLAEEDELRDSAIGLAVDIARAAPLALRSIRETMRAPLMEAVRRAVVRERAEQDRLRNTEDFRAGVAARRGEVPRFYGR